MTFFSICKVFTGAKISTYTYPYEHNQRRYLSSRKHFTNTKKSHVMS